MSEDITVVLPELQTTMAKPGEKPPVQDAPKQISRRELGRLRRQYITKVHNTVTKCGHKFDPNSIPRTNCEFCWEAYFRTVVDLVELRAELEQSIRAVEIKRGKVFVKQFKKFLHASLGQP